MAEAEKEGWKCDLKLTLNSPIPVYTCHGSWTHNGTVFIVARHVGSQHGVCMSYRAVEAGSAQLIIGDVCLRNLQPPAEHHLVANLTVHGKAEVEDLFNEGLSNGLPLFLCRPHGNGPGGQVLRQECIESRLRRVPNYPNCVINIVGSGAVIGWLVLSRPASDSIAR